MPPPVPVDSTTGVLKLAGLAELLGDRGGEGEDGRGADDAGSGRGPAAAAGDAGERGQAARMRRLVHAGFLRLFESKVRRDPPSHAARP